MTTGLPPGRALTPYRVGVLVKLLLFLAMTALALVNRYVFAPRRAATPRHPPARWANSRRASPRSPTSANSWVTTPCDFSNLCRSEEPA